MRFGAFEALTGASKRGQLPDRVGQPAMDMVNGMLAGSVEAVLCQTPNQVIAIKMIHDASPRGPRRYNGLFHAVGTMWREGGFLAFYQGVVPAVVKGASTNLIRFPVYGMLKRLVQGDEGDARPLTPMMSMLCGGTAGAISAVFTQPIDTVKANMMGLDAGRFKSSLGCAAELVRAGGFGVLMNGVGPRVCRVFIEVGTEAPTWHGGASRRSVLWVSYGLPTFACDLPKDATRDVHKNRRPHVLTHGRFPSPCLSSTSLRGRRTGWAAVFLV